MILLRRIAVVAAGLFAVVAGQASGAGLIGQSPAEFAADSAANLRVAGWAFAIWAPLYLGVLLFAGWQCLRRSEGSLTRALSWPAALAFALIGLWVVAAGLDWEAATMVVIVSATLSLILPLWARAADVRSASGLARRLGVWPLAALAGWLTVASPVNLVTVLTGNGDLPGVGLAWSLSALAAVSAAALAVSARLRMIAYAIPIAWGLFGIAVAELTRNPALGWSAAAAVLITVAGSLWLARAR